jgi:hypothetical protein
MGNRSRFTQVIIAVAILLPAVFTGAMVQPSISEDWDTPAIADNADNWDGGAMRAARDDQYRPTYFGPLHSAFETDGSYSETKSVTPVTAQGADDIG